MKLWVFRELVCELSSKCASVTPLKLAGSLAIVVGAGAATVAALALDNSTEVSTAAADIMASMHMVFDQSNWLFHWKLNSAAIGTSGIALIAAGIACVKGYARGLIAIACIALLVAALPWISTIIGFSRYAFESGSVLESAIFCVVAAAYVGLYREEHHGHFVVP